MAKLTSGRVKKKSQFDITNDRYQFLGLEQAEPNLGDPKVGPSSVGLNPIKAGPAYQVISIDGYPGERFWLPVSGLGSTMSLISVYDEGNLVTEGFSKIAALNFVGSAVTILRPIAPGPFPNTGLATVKIEFDKIPNQGSVNQLIFNSSSGFINGATNFYYNSGNVGIGTATPRANLDVVGVVSATEYYGNFKGSIDPSVVMGNATYATLSGVATYATRAGVSTNAEGLIGTPNIIVGIVTATEYYGLFKGTINPGVVLDTANYANRAGIATYATSAGFATNSSIAGFATYATSSGFATYATRAGVATNAEGLTGTPNIIIGIATATEYYGTFRGTLDPTLVLENSNYANKAGVATYATSAGFATNSSIAGLATYATKAGLATYSDNSGIATYSTRSGIATYATRSGVATNAEGLTGTPNIVVGIVTATEYYGVFKGTINPGVVLDTANYANRAGIATYATSAGFATNSSIAGFATYATSSGFATYATISGFASNSTSSGIATYATNSGISTYSTRSGIATYATRSGVATNAEGLTGTPNIVVGIVTATEYYGVFKGTINPGVPLDVANYANFAGIATYAMSSGIATYATKAGLATYADVSGVAGFATLSGNAGISTYATISGFATNAGSASLATYAIKAGVATNAEGLTGTPNIVVGIVTATDYYGTFRGVIASGVGIGTAESVSGGFVDVKNLRVSGVSTFTNGPVLIGSATSTGTSNQPLQVTGNSYISGNLAIGKPSASFRLDLDGNSNLNGNLDVSGVFKLGSFEQSTVNSSLATSTRYGITRLATDLEIDNGLLGSPPLTVPAAVQPHQLVKVFASADLLLESQSIFYVDGQVVSEPSGVTSYSSIPNEVWTDLWANRVPHKFTSTWTGSPLKPTAGSGDAILAQRVVFKTIKDVFTFINDRNAYGTDTIYINLYNSSDSNAGVTTTSFITNYYNGSSKIYFKKGNSAAYVGVGSEPWGVEHYSGLLDCLNATVIFNTANINISGIASYPNRLITTNQLGIRANNVQIINSRFAYNITNQVGYSLIIDTTNDLSIEADPFMNSGAGKRNTVEFVQNYLQAAGIPPTFYYTVACRSGNNFTLNGRHSNSFYTGNTTSGDTLTLNYFTSQSYNTSKNLASSFAIFSRDAIFVLDSIAGVLPYGGVNFNINLSNTQNILNFFTFQSFGRPYVQVLHSYSSSTPINILGINANSSFNAGISFYTPIRGDFTFNASSPINTNNLFTKIATALEGVGFSTANTYSWSIPSASTRDGIFFLSGEYV